MAIGHPKSPAGRWGRVLRWVLAALVLALAPAPAMGAVPARDDVVLVASRGMTELVALRAPRREPASPMPSPRPALRGLSGAPVGSPAVPEPRWQRAALYLLHRALLR